MCDAAALVFIEVLHLFQSATAWLPFHLSSSPVLLLLTDLRALSNSSGVSVVGGTTPLRCLRRSSAHAIASRPSSCAHRRQA